MQAHSTRPGFDQRRACFKLTPSQLYWKTVSRGCCAHLRGVRSADLRDVNIVGGEFLINFGGGAIVNEPPNAMTARTYAAICFVIMVSVLFFIATERIERWLRPGT